MANSSDGKRVSDEKHEINYTGGKVAKQEGVSRQEGKEAVKEAKKETGTVSRDKVEKKAKDIA